jgi:predicted Rossmann fold nucleotide-binding protein DprA/Smf involved in DNA uptake
MPDLLREPREVMREEMLMRDQVLDALADGPLTVPEIAEILGFPPHEVMYWVMAAWKYGYVTETDTTDDDHYRYAIAAKEQ